MTVSSCVMWTG